jgi:hypothetical protein
MIRSGHTLRPETLDRKYQAEHAQRNGTKPDPALTDRQSPAHRGNEATSCEEATVVNAKRKGTRNEHRSMQLLEAAGYLCTRAAASLGIFDVVGIGPSDVVLVQIKTRDWPGRVELEAIKNFPCPPLCKKLIHRWRDRQPMPDVKTV